uniref:Uncharacterized protein n=1 Tax=Romanomermis culicivorax TaxID=13658 RepID=A0A915K912_ROMCU
MDVFKVACLKLLANLCATTILSVVTKFKLHMTYDLAENVENNGIANFNLSQPMAVGGKSDADQKSEVISPVWIGVLIAGSILIIVIIAAIVIFRIRNKSKSNDDISKSNAERSNDGGDSTEDASAAVKQRQKQAATEHERELSNILSKRSTPFKAPTDKSCVPHDDPQYQTLYEVPDMDKILRMSDMPSKTTKV